VELEEDAAEPKARRRRRQRREEHERWGHDRDRGVMLENMSSAVPGGRVLLLCLCPCLHLASEVVVWST
jgi:hypothetical protein